MPAVKIPSSDPELLSLNTATVREKWNLRAIDDATALGARCLVLVVGGLPQGSKDLGGAREMVRDGVINLLQIRSWMDQAGYRGFHEVEIFSARNGWQREPDDVFGVMKRRHQECC